MYLTTIISKKVKNILLPLLEKIPYLHKYKYNIISKKEKFDYARYFDILNHLEFIKN